MSDPFKIEIPVDSGSNFLEPGQYRFRVANWERKENANGNAYAEVTLEVEQSASQKREIRDRLYMTERAFWRVSEFFVAIGMVDPGQESFMTDFDGAIGKSGYADIVAEEFENSSGETKSAIKVSHYLKPGAESDEDIPF